MDAGLEQLVEWLKSVSPALLVAAKQKVQADLVTNVMYFLGFLVLTAILFGAMEWGWKHKDDGGDEGFLGTMAVAFGAIFGVVGLALTIASLGGVLQIVIAPDYATIKALVDLAHTAIGVVK